jgi:hypothetical protein
LVIKIRTGKAKPTAHLSSREHRSLAMNASKVANASFRATKFVAIMKRKRRKMEEHIIQQWPRKWTMTK